MPEEKGLYPKIKIKDQLTYLAELRGLSRRDAKAAVALWLNRLEMSEYLDKKLETLSKGNQQKIQLAVALVADPEIVILDEPFSGLDPVNSQLLKDVVNEQVALGKIVLFSSHQMNYVETFCDDLALLHGGEIVLHGNIREIKRRYPRNRISISLSDGNGNQAWPAARIQDWLNKLTRETSRLQTIIAAIEQDGEQCRIVLRQADQRDQLLQELVRVQAPLEQFGIVEPTLEDIFIEKTGDRPGSPVTGEGSPS
jgi:ABC-2 type transport system ATP-binding protein